MRGLLLKPRDGPAATILALIFATRVPWSRRTIHGAIPIPGVAARIPMGLVFTSLLIIMYWACISP